MAFLGTMMVKTGFIIFHNLVRLKNYLWKQAWLFLPYIASEYQKVPSQIVMNLTHNSQSEWLFWAIATLIGSILWQFEKGSSIFTWDMLWVKKCEIMKDLKMTLFTGFFGVFIFVLFVSTKISQNFLHFLFPKKEKPELNQNLWKASSSFQFCAFAI